MKATRYNSVEWFEVATDKPEEAKKFYGELFGWTYESGKQYSEVTTPGSESPTGGIFDTGGDFPGYAIFYVIVEDVPATLAKAESLGAKTVVPPTTTPDGLVFAQLRDSTGNHFGVFSGPRVRLTKGVASAWSDSRVVNQSPDPLARPGV